MTLVAGWAAQAGLEPAIDAHGNLWALPPDWDGPLVTSGSHVDTVPDGGRHDGALGTVLALELAEELREGTAGGRAPGAAGVRRRGGAALRRRHVGSRLLAGTLDDGGARADARRRRRQRRERPRRLPRGALGAAARCTSRRSPACGPTSRSTSRSAARSTASASSSASRRRGARGSS